MVGTEEVAFGWKGLSLKDIRTLGGNWGSLEGVGSYQERSTEHIRGWERTRKSHKDNES